MAPTVLWLLLICSIIAFCYVIYAIIQGENGVTILTGGGLVISLLALVFSISGLYIQNYELSHYIQ